MTGHACVTGFMPGRRASWRSRRFQHWAAAQHPSARARGDARMARRCYDLVAGFLHSQVLMAFVELDLGNTCRAGPTGSNPSRF